MTDAQLAAHIPDMFGTKSAERSMRVFSARVPTTREQYTQLDKLHTECVRGNDYAAAHAVFTLMYRSNVK